MNTTLERVYAEMVRGHALHGRYNSDHEAYAVLLEELDEVWDEVKLRSEKRDYSRMRSELIQVAAVACRWAEQLTDKRSDVDRDAMLEARDA
jgi:hypothetical protein